MSPIVGAGLDAGDEVEVGELLDVFVQGRRKQRRILVRESDRALEAVVDVLGGEDGRLQEVGAVVVQVEVEAGEVGVLGLV